MESGVVPGIIKTFSDCHLYDRESILRAYQCFLGICMKNDKVITAFKETGGQA